MPGSTLDQVPAGYELLAAAVAVIQRPKLEWRASPLNYWRLSHPEPEGIAARPKDLRPADPENGRRILAGGFVFAGETLTTGPRGDPWDRPTPSRRFANALHGFGWLGDLTAHGEPGAWEALRLTLAWRRLFGRWGEFSWAPQVLERRVFNLACAIAALSGPASDAEADQISADLALQARFLLEIDEGPPRATERAVAAAVAGAALGGAAGEGLLERALERLAPALARTVAPDGGHMSRSPQAALELFFDLITLTDALAQHGVEPPADLLRAIDRLGGAVRFFTLRDGTLAAFQGGAPLPATYVAAARAMDEAGERAAPSSRNGYFRMEGRSLQVIADLASPAPGAWSQTACAQPLAIAVLAGGKPLILGAGWSPQSHAPQALRLVDAASTLSVSDAGCGAPLSGFAAGVLGPRLRDAYAVSEVERHDDARGAVWLEASHDGWVRRFGLRHERRLFLDVEADELRGEDALVALAPPKASGGGRDGRRFVPFVVRFHLHPQVSALIARDKTSVLLKTEGDDTGWWLRSDAIEATLEPSPQHRDGQIRHGQQIVLRGQARLDAGAKLRWKLSAASQDRTEPAPVDEGQGWA